MDTPTPLEIQFSVERLRRYLKDNPQEAAELAVNYLEDFLVLASEYKRLEANFDQLQAQIHTPTPLSLPSFLT